MNTALYSGMIVFAGLPAAVANVMAAVLVIMPRYALYKYWVWATPERSKSGREIRTHLVLAGLGVTTSTAAVWMIEKVNASVALLAVGQLSAYATIWVVRFFVLNRVFLSSHVART